MRSLSLGWVFLLAASWACGGNGEAPDAAVDAPPVDARVATAADYEGLWLIRSMTSVGPQTLTRDGIPQSVRGDALVTATGATTGTMDLRLAVLDGGLLAGPFLTQVHDLVVEDDRWVLSTDEETVVFATALDGPRLVLSFDADDPRNAGGNPPLEVVLDRVTPWPDVLVGHWELISLTLPSQMVVAGVCTEIQAGSRWAKIAQDIVFDARLVFEQTTTVDVYDDDACTSRLATQTSGQVGMAEADDVEHLRLWTIDDADVAGFQAFTMEVADGAATLTLTACLPAPACEDTAPTEVRVHLVP